MGNFLHLLLLLPCYIFSGSLAEQQVNVLQQALDLL